MGNSILRGQCIRNLEDFNYYLSYATGLAEKKRPYIKKEMMSLIIEAQSMQVFDKKKAVDYVSKINDVRDASVTSGLELNMNNAKDFHLKTLDYRWNYEQEYGTIASFEKAYNDLENYICIKLSLLETFDENYRDFKQQAFENLNRAKRLKCKSDEQSLEVSWQCLHRVYLNILDNNEYFIIKLDKAKKHKAGSKLKLNISNEKQEAIINLIKGVDNKTISKVYAQMEATILIYGRDSATSITHDTFTKWQKKYQETGSILPSN
ncbi:hypothetical protein V6248_03715 [Pseudoalteromonas agarivorans]|uniref:hypothetical protein n=1 Tax=Pseudoalteromonas agarivorans TaxID=176102 RepID=UPI00311D8DCE